MFDHEKLQVYKRSTQWLAISNNILKSLPKGNQDIANQLKRAALSIPLNIAEGAGKTSLGDKKRYYGIARGSSLECVAILDAMEILNLSDSNSVKDGREVLHSIVSMLSRLCV